MKRQETIFLFVCLKVFRLFKGCLRVRECLIVTQVLAQALLKEVMTDAALILLSCRMYLCRQFSELETDGNLFKHLPNCSSASNVLFCFNIFADLNYSSSSVALSLSLGLPLSCQCHSGLEADKQAEELRTNSISHSVCLIGDQCDAAGGWCSPLSESLPSGTLTFTTNCHTLMPKLRL